MEVELLEFTLLIRVYRSLMINKLNNLGENNPERNNKLKQYLLDLNERLREFINNIQRVGDIAREEDFDLLRESIL